jgi:hypothetical protein
MTDPETPDLRGLQPGEVVDLRGKRPLSEAESLENARARHPAGRHGTREGFLAAARAKVRRIALVRHEDVSGVSGTGVVAYGVLFPDGTIVLRWDTKVRSTTFYDSLADLETITGHGGKTTVELLDEMNELIPPSSVADANIPDQSAVAAGYGATSNLPDAYTEPDDVSCLHCHEQIVRMEGVGWVHALTQKKWSDDPIAFRHRATPSP